MVTPGGGYVTVNDAEIASMFIPGGDVWRQTRDLGATHYREARILVPKRSGNAFAKHRITMTPNRAYVCQYTVACDADYAGFVILGTTGPIHADRYSGRNKFFPRKGWPRHRWVARSRSTRGLMTVRPAPHSWYPVPWLRATVKGQKANDWLMESFGVAWPKWVASQRFEAGLRR